MVGGLNYGCIFGKPAWLLAGTISIFVRIVFLLGCNSGKCSSFLICLIRHSLVAGFSLLTQPGCFSG